MIMLNTGTFVGAGRRMVEKRGQYMKYLPETRPLNNLSWPQSRRAAAGAAIIGAAPANPHSRASANAVRTTSYSLKTIR